MDLTLAIDSHNHACVAELIGGVEHRTTGSVFPFGARMVFRERDATFVSANGTAWHLKRRDHESIENLRWKIRNHQSVHAKASRLSKGDLLLIVDGAEVLLTPQHNSSFRGHNHSFRSYRARFADDLRTQRALLHNLANMVAVCH
jgi:hypothetical protein